VCAAQLTSARKELESSSIVQSASRSRVEVLLPELVLAADMGGAPRALLWARTLAARWKQLERLHAAGPTVRPVDAVWLGGLSEPLAFLSATRQQTARMRGCNLEELQLRLQLDCLTTDVAASAVATAAIGVQVLGLTVQGVGVRDGVLIAIEDTAPLHARLVWAPPAERPSSQRYIMPLYADNLRRMLLAEVELALPTSLQSSGANPGGSVITQGDAMQRGAALFATADPQVL